MRVVGVGNRWRCDDAAGLEVAARLGDLRRDGVEVLEREGEPTSLIDSFADAAVVWVVDAVSSGSPPGTLHRLEAAERELPPELFRTSTHHVGLAETVELARAVGSLPARLVVFGIEGARFDVGEGLTPAVARAVEDAVAAIRREARACTSGR